MDAIAKYQTANFRCDSSRPHSAHLKLAKVQKHKSKDQSRALTPPTKLPTGIRGSTAQHHTHTHKNHVGLTHLSAPSLKRNEDIVAQEASKIRGIGDTAET